MARPKKHVDPQVVEKLAGMGLSAELIGAYFDVDHKTIERRFGPILKKGRQIRDGRLMVKLYQEAMGTPDKPGSPGKPCNTAIAIFLAKNWLGMSDRPDPDVVVNVQQNNMPVRIIGMPTAEIEKFTGPDYEQLENGSVARVVAGVKVIYARTT